MGQYHMVVNLDKKEFLDPHSLGCGLKLMEQAGTQFGTAGALLILLACSNGRGGGDCFKHPYVGRWAGDHIAVVGDYAEDTDLALKHEAGRIYEHCLEGTGGYVDISRTVRDILSWEYELSYEGRWWDGGREITPGERVALHARLIAQGVSAFEIGAAPHLHDEAE
jgi:hypothetical protein